MGASLWPDGKHSADWYSIAGLMREWERENAASLRFTLCAAGTDKAPDLSLRLDALPMGAENTAVAPLASVSCRCSKERAAHLMGVCIFLVYQMDFVFEQHGVGEAGK